MIEKRLSRASIKKILESRHDGSREGALITEDKEYVSNGAFLIKNVYNFDEDLKLYERKRMTRKHVEGLLDKSKACTVECKYAGNGNVDGHGNALITFKSEKHTVYVTKKYLQVIFQSALPNEKVDLEKTVIYVRPDFAYTPVGVGDHKLGKYFGTPIMPINKQGE